MVYTNKVTYVISSLLMAVCVVIYLMLNVKNTFSYTHIDNNWSNNVLSSKYSNRLFRNPYMVAIQQLIQNVDSANDTIPEFLDLEILKTFEDPNQTEGKLNGVVIMAGYHTGSSFTGNLFKASKDVFYMFEPLAFICFGRNWRKQRYNQKFMSQVLQELLNCNATELFRNSKTYFPSLQTQRQKWISKTFNLNLPYFDVKSAELVDIIHQSCMELSSITVIKVIRVETISSVLPLILAGVKVFNLIRDPRGLARSRFKNRNISLQTLSEHMLFECKKQSRNLRFLKQASEVPVLHSALMSNYRLVRYEDIAYDPLGIPKKMYKFVGLNFTDDTRTYVNKFVPLDTDISISRRIASRWKYEMEFEYVRQVEDICKDMMDNLGFVIHQKEADYRNDVKEVLADITSEIPYVFH